MKVLILSCNTGEGHNAAARAIREQLAARGHETEILDMMMLSGKRASRMVGGAYVNMVKYVPVLFRGLYRLGSAISSSERKSPVFYANSLLAKHLAAYLEEHPFDIVVTTHLFPAETMTYMKHHKMLGIPAVAVATDYTCIPFWEETDCDFYVIPHPDLARDFEERGVPAEKLLPMGIPVSPRFSRRKEKQEARRECGLPEEGLIYLVMSGSMGFGKVHLFATMLEKQCGCGEHIVIICGHNVSMMKTLQRQFRGNSRVHIIGFTDKVADYMDACDVNFTKPGGLSSTEAAVKRIPIVHTSQIPGCETKNLEFFTSRGLSVAAHKIRDQVSCGTRLAREEDKRKEMISAQGETINPCTAQEIAGFLERISTQGNSHNP